MSENREHVEVLLGDPWAVAMMVCSVVVAFIAWLFREVIKEGLLWRLKAKRDRAGKIAEAESLFNPGEREILMMMAKVGGRLSVSSRDLLEDKPNPIKVRAIVDEWRMQVAIQKDVFALDRRKFIENDGKRYYELTDKGRATGEELIKLFGLSASLASGHESKET